MTFDKKNLLRTCLFFLVFAFAGATAHAVTITRTSSPVFYYDTSITPQLRCMYVSYRVTNDGAYQPDVYANVGSFTGGRGSGIATGNLNGSRLSPATFAVIRRLATSSETSMVTFSSVMPFSESRERIRSARWMSSDRGPRLKPT